MKGCGFPSDFEIVISRKHKFLAIVQFMLWTQNKTITMNSKERFDIIEKLLEFGVEHVVDDILMMLDIEDLAQFAQVNRWELKLRLCPKIIYMGKVFKLFSYLKCNHHRLWNKILDDTSSHWKFRKRSILSREPHLTQLGNNEKLFYIGVTLLVNILIKLAKNGSQACIFSYTTRSL